MDIKKYLKFLHPKLFRPDGGRNQFAARPPVVDSVVTTENGGSADLPNRFSSTSEDNEAIAVERREGLRSRFTIAEAESSNDGRERMLNRYSGVGNTPYGDTESAVPEENGDRRNLGFGAENSGK